MLVNAAAARVRVRRLLRARKNDDPGLHAFLNCIVDAGPVYLFGGAIRDIALRGTRGFSSDIDLVVDSEGLDSFMRRNGYKSSRNRFGGHRLWFNHQAVDVWELHRTWAFSENLVRPATVQALPETTFFTWDAIALEVTTGRFVSRPGYFEELRSNVLDINLAENPNPIGSAARILRIVERAWARLAPSLWRHLLSQLVRYSELELARKSDNQFLASKPLWIKLVHEKLERHAMEAPAKAFSLHSTHEPRAMALTQLEFESVGLGELEADSL